MNFKFRNASKLHSTELCCSFARYIYDTYRMYISAVGSIIAAWKLQQSHNNKHNKRNISTNSSCPYIKLFLPPSPLLAPFVCIYAGTKELAYQSGKRVVWQCGRRDVFFLFFRVWHGMGWLTVCSQELEVAKRAPHLGRGLENELLCHWLL